MSRSLWGVVGAAVAVLLAVGLFAWQSQEHAEKAPSAAPGAEPGAEPGAATSATPAPLAAAPAAGEGATPPARTAGEADDAPAATTETAAEQTAPEAASSETASPETAATLPSGAADAPAAADGATGAALATLPADTAGAVAVPESTAGGGEAVAPAGSATPDAAAPGSGASETAALDPAAPEAASPATADAASPEAGAATAPAAEADPATAASPAADSTEAARPASETAVEAAPDIALDIVRIDAAGEAVIAGRTEPGATVEILLDGAVVATETAGADGSFVALASLGQSSEARALQLRLARPEAVVAAGSGSAAEGGTGEGGEVLALADADAAGVSAPVVILPAGEGDAAPLIVAPEGEAVALLQPAEVEVGRVVLDRITYSPGGDAVASGRARAGHAVRAYVNAVYVADVTVAPGGTWELSLPREVVESAKLLRFDEVSAEGAVTSRLETAFTYDDGNTPVESRQRLIRVQRGDNLWRIAEQHYGAGLRYSVIFSANAGLIRDPDLIYPGQVFTIPELIASE